MKKLLGLLGAAGLVATTSATVVACGTPANKTPAKASDVTLKSGELSKDFTVKSDKILAEGTVTTKLAENSVLTVAVKEGSVKAGEVTLTISTTEEKLTDKEVTESVSVLFKAKDAAKEAEVATVSVTVQAKKEEKKDLSTVPFTGFTATNATTNDQVIAELQKVDGLSKLAALDVTIDKVIASAEKAGSIKIAAKESSKLVKGEKTLVIAQLATEKKDLSTVPFTGFTATNATSNDQVIAELQKVEGLSKLAALDVTIDKVIASAEKAGSIKIAAKESSKLVKGEKTLVIAKLS